MWEKIQRLKFHDFNICPNILHADADTDADTDADAGGYSNSSSALKCRRAKNLKLGNLKTELIFFISLYTKFILSKVRVQMHWPKGHLKAIVIHKLLYIYTHT